MVVQARYFSKVKVRSHTQYTVIGEGGVVSELS